MIRVIVTSYKEPKATEHAVNALLSQKCDQEFKIIVTDPFPEVEEYIKKRFGDNKKVQFVRDSGEGKSVTLNQMMEEYWSEDTKNILMFTDGDVYLDPNALQEVMNIFKDNQIGVVCGHPVAVNERNTMFGFWAHLAFDEMNNTRVKLAKKKKFFEVSGYLFAIRNGVIKSFSTESSEDNVIPHLFWEKGLKIGYAENARVFVLNPQNMKDWINQKKRNIKGHISLTRTVGEKRERKNTFLGEAKRGLKMIRYPKDVAEYAWFLMLMGARAYAWMRAMYEAKVKKQQYKDGWREVEMQSTKPLD